MMKKLIVVGGGFAGAKVAKKLQKKFDIFFIDNRDYFEFTPGILRSIVYPSHLRRIQICHVDYVKNGRVIKDNIIKIKGKNVFLKNGEKLNFDYLVICSGSKYNTPIKAKNILIADRGKNISDYHDVLDKAKSIVIVGGGLVGTELAGEITDKYKDKKLTIVHSKDRLMERNKPKVSEYGKKFLEKRKVKIILNEKVSKIGKDFVTTDKGNRIKCDLAIICTGIIPNSDFMPRSSIDERGFIKVNDFLQMETRKDVFVCGDVAGVLEEKTAQGAEKQARHVIRNIKLLEKKERLKEYKPRRRFMVISLGMWDGIIEQRYYVLTGIIPAFMKWTIERWKMLKYYKL